MKIGFDAKRAFQNKTGLGNYSRNLLHHLAQYHPDSSYTLYAPKITEDFQHLAQKFKVITPESKNPLWRSFNIKKDIAKESIDIFHGLSNELPFGISKLSTASIVTIHDIIFDRIPEDFGYFDRQVFSLKTKSCLRESDKIIAISQATKNDILDRYEVDEEKISVIYQPHDPIFTKEPLPSEIRAAKQKELDLPSEFILYVGSIMKRKNTLRLIRAWEQLPEKPNLIIYGNGNYFRKDIQKYIRDRHLSPRVQLRQPVAFHDLPDLYKMASSVIYPSLLEGFGLPVLEALACGAKVVTSNISSMPEAGGDHCTYVDPYDVEAIAQGMKESLFHFHHDEVKLQQHLDTFHPERLTNQVYKEYQNIIIK
ncbi:glycosyltransferase family 4 protein [Membranihabitans marinus]|uniref:glycosyltransferase family 4 protein n=1 Tax=Membranihabitans marinus TaxID=1227546 RepID=UPI001F16D151|nr:glycosyltransferase family 1 protein [Membranihabitans marinus]